MNLSGWVKRGVMLAGIAWMAMNWAPSPVAAVPVIFAGGAGFLNDSFCNNYTFNFTGLGPNSCSTVAFCTAAQGRSPSVFVPFDSFVDECFPSFSECLAPGCYIMHLACITPCCGGSVFVECGQPLAFNVCGCKVTQIQPGEFSFSQSNGSFGAMSGGGGIDATPAPEIDPTTFVTPLALAVGGLVIVADRRRASQRAKLQQAQAA